MSNKLKGWTAPQVTSKFSNRSSNRKIAVHRENPQKTTQSKKAPQSKLPYKCHKLCLQDSNLLRKSSKRVKHSQVANLSRTSNNLDCRKHWTICNRLTLQIRISRMRLPSMTVKIGHNLRLMTWKYFWTNNTKLIKMRSMQGSSRRAILMNLTGQPATLQAGRMKKELSMEMRVLLGMVAENVNDQKVSRT